MLKTIQNVFAEHLCLEPESITIDTHLYRDLQLDEIDVFDLTMELEDEFEIEIPDGYFAKFETIGDIIRFIEKI